MKKVTQITAIILLAFLASCGNKEIEPTTNVEIDGGNIKIDVKEGEWESTTNVEIDSDNEVIDLKEGEVEQIVLTGSNLVVDEATDEIIDEDVIMEEINELEELLEIDLKEWVVE